jgi:hypothetical protein
MVAQTSAEDKPERNQQLAAHNIGCKPVTVATAPASAMV